MTDPRTLSPADLEILLARELRKAGLELPSLRIRRRSALDEEIGRWDLLMEARLRAGASDERLLIQCHNRVAPVARALVDRLVAAAHEDGFTKAMIVSLSGYEPDAVARAGALGIALLGVTDGASAWRSSGWGVQTQPPAWFPELVAQIIAMNEMREVRAELVPSNRPAAILDRLRELPARAKGADERRDAGAAEKSDGASG